MEKIRKWKKQILCILAGFLLFGAAVGEEARDCVSRGYLERSGYGEEGRVYDLVVEGLGKKPVNCSVEIEPLKYSKEEAEAIFDRLIRELPDLIAGENPSLDQVRRDLNLITLSDDTGVRISWQSQNPKLLDSYGQIAGEGIPKEGEKVILEAVLTDGVYEKEALFPVVVHNPMKSEIEEKEEAFIKMVREADTADPQAREVVLPAEYEGHSLRFRREGSRDYYILPFLGVAGAVLLWGQEKAGKEKRQKQKKQLLLLDYADVVYQLMVYTGAGLTMEKAWEQMVEDYEKERNHNSGPVRPAYEEMAVTLNQIRNGESEGKAISRFGKRCGLQPYMKLSSLLEQNRKTGTRNLNQLLEQEMSSAWDQQKHTARRMGEEAKAKLLAPLFLMLLVVMVIIMVPALMAVTE